MSSACWLLWQIRRCCICLETFLKLIVSKLDKRIVLLGQLQSQNSIVLFADFRFSLLQHSFTDEAHLLECEQWLVSWAVVTKLIRRGGQSHQWRWWSWAWSWWGWASRAFTHQTVLMLIAEMSLVVVEVKLFSSLKTFHFFPNISQYLLRSKFWRDLTKWWLFMALGRWCSWWHANWHTSPSLWCAPTRTMNWIKLQTTLQSNTSHLCSIWLQKSPTVSHRKTR